MLDPREGFPVRSVTRAACELNHLTFWMIVAALLTFAPGSWVLAQGEPVRLSPCFTIDPDAPVLAGEFFTLDASCTETEEGVRVTGLEWRLGEDASPRGETVEYSFLDPGEYEIELAVTAGADMRATARKSVFVAERFEGSWSEFEEDGADLEGWSPREGRWFVSEGVLRVEEVANSHRRSLIWAGGSPGIVENRSLQSFHSMDVQIVELLAPEEGAREVGCLLFSAEPADGEDVRGYVLEWVEEISGLRLSRRDGHETVVLYEGAPPDGRFPTDWSIGIDRDTISFSSGSDFFFEVEDPTYRQGFLGFTLGDGSRLGFDSLLVFRGHGDLPILRGDCDSDGQTAGINDAITLLSHNFFDPRPLPCAASCDANADADISGVTDAIMMLVVNFIGGIQFAEPHPWCGFTGRESDFELGCNRISPACN